LGSIQNLAISSGSDRKLTELQEQVSEMSMKDARIANGADR